MLKILALADAQPALPEIVLVVATLVLLMLGVMRDKSESFDFICIVAVIALAGAAALVLLSGPDRLTAFHGSFVVDTFARVMKVMALFASALAIIMSTSIMKADRLDRFEYPVLILMATIGMMVMISANDLISLYLGLELQSLALYVVAAIDRDNVRSSEAGLKYFVLGALSSGMLLYGVSLIYGFTGVTAFAAVAEQIKANGAGIGLIFGLVFLIAGLAFKVSAVPFHMWTPDVYEGSPTPVTNFFAAATKVAAMALFVRAMVQPFPAIAADWQQIVVFISIASMGLGAFAAIGQNNIKRLLAYSSIGNVGYALIGLAAGGIEGVRGVVLYMLIYMMMTLGSFAIVIAMRRNGRAVEEIGELAGLARTDRAMAFVLAMLMFSLAGIPPLAGFFAKYFVFLAAIKANLVALAVIGVLTSVVGAYYYLRIVKLIYFDEPAPRFDAAPLEINLVAAMMGLFVLGFVFVAHPLLIMAQAAAQSLF
jgi:NADH-quinone oxidoreductase subunit N